MPKFAKGKNSKNKKNFFYLSPDYLHIIPSQLTKFEPPSFNIILITKFHSKPLERGITPQKGDF